MLAARFAQVAFGNPGNGVAQDWYIQFDLFLREVGKRIGDKKIILALDEFETIEKAINKDRVEPQFLNYLRYQIQGPRWLTLIFAGLHTMDEMARNYWHPFYGSVKTVRVRYLSHTAAERLITNPTEDFLIDYDKDVIEHIIQITNGQPYLIQQICRDLVSCLNHLIFDEGREREARITLEDVKAVLDEEFFQRGQYYFVGVWGRESEEAKAILRAMALSGGGWTVEQTIKATGLGGVSIQKALTELERHDVLERVGMARWRYQVELMRWWVERRETK